MLLSDWLLLCGSSLQALSGTGDSFDAGMTPGNPFHCTLSVLGGVFISIRNPTGVFLFTDMQDQVKSLHLCEFWGLLLGLKTGRTRYISAAFTDFKRKSSSQVLLINAQDLSEAKICYYPLPDGLKSIFSQNIYKMLFFPKVHVGFFVLQLMAGKLEKVWISKICLEQLKGKFL